MMPSRLTGAFPEGVEVRRLGLKDVIAETRGFFEAEAEIAARAP
jgi:ATP-dependent DNA helicase DinG